VYPNPTSGQLRISVPSEGGANTAEDIQVFDVVGRLLQSKIVNLQSEIILDISHLASGLYYLKIDNKTVKVIKE
jgi:UDP-3-O-acyl-N-acetylglucosamine deacetylase